MEITLLGVITAIMCIYAFFKNEKLLLYMLVFFSTFTAAELFHINITTTPIQTFEFIGAVWLFREFINFLKSKPKINKDIIINKFKENKLATAFIIFIIAIILGELALAISGLSVDYINIANEPGTVKFCMSNITQAIIIIFVFVIMTVLSFKIKTKEEAKELLKIFCISSMFAVVWGLLQFITYYFGIKYPAFLFNNNAYAVQFYNQIENNIKRISSIALEPSMFAVNLVCFIPFALGTYLKLKEKIKEKKYIISFIIIVLTTACAILTTSSTTYIGLVVTYGLFGLYILFGFIRKGELADRKRNFMKMVAVVVTSVAVAGSLCWVSVKIGYKLGTIDYIVVKPEENKDTEEVKYSSALDNMTKMLKQMTIDKLVSGSGQERLNGEKIGLSMLKYSPIFGIGFGSYRTFSLFTNILLNTGIVGICAYLYILYIVIKELIKYRKKDEATSVMFLISIIGSSMAFFVGVPDLVLTFYWIIMVIAYKYSTLEK